MELSWSAERRPVRKEPRLKDSAYAELRPWREAPRRKSPACGEFLPDLKVLRFKLPVAAERRGLRTELPPKLPRFVERGAARKERRVELAELLPALEAPPLMEPPLADARLKEPPRAAPLVPPGARPRLAMTWLDIKPTRASMAIKRMYLLKVISHLALALYIATALFARL